MENNAVFHKDCYAKYNKSKLARKRNLFEKGHETEPGRTETVENSEITETQRKLTQSSISLKNFTRTYLFCDKDDRYMKLHLRQTFQAQRKIEEITQDNGNTKVVAKLSACDMIATEANYHCKCLAAY